MTGKAKVPDLYWMRRIAEVIDLGHAARAPVGCARHQKGNAGLAFPPALVGILEAAEPRDQNRIGGAGAISQFLRIAPQSTQLVCPVAISLPQVHVLTEAQHLR